MAVICPYCEEDCTGTAEFVDIGMGAEQQVSPHHCHGCGATEIGPYDNLQDASEEEVEKGWYKG